MPVSPYPSDPETTQSPALHAGLVARCRRIIEEQIRALESSPELLRIPRPVGERRRIPDAPFHLYPEMFFQLSGTTSFRMPEDTLTLMPHELCLMPRLIPHRERASAWEGKSFFNLVVMLSDTSISFHTAAETRGKPYILEAERFEFAGAGKLTQTLNELIELSGGPSTHGSPRKAALRHLAASLLYMLLDLLSEEKPVPFYGHPRIARARKLVEINLADPRLSVRTIAEWVQCTPDYLSHLFRTETGETLIRFINRKRIAAAQTLLETGSLNISETAWACGFDDPAYFCRVFRTVTGSTPREFRGRSQAVS